jgi:hypothetical protein
MSFLSPDWWQAVSPYLDEALDMPEPERAVWMTSLRSSNPALAAELQILLEEHRDLGQKRFWLLEKKGETCKLTLTHDDFDGETKTYKSVGKGWNPVLSGLKTLLETGKPLKIASA